MGYAGPQRGPGQTKQWRRRTEEEAIPAAAAQTQEQTRRALVKWSRKQAGWQGTLVPGNARAKRLAMRALRERIARQGNG